MEQLSYQIYFVCIFINFAVGYPRRFFCAKHLHGCKLFPIFAVLLLDPLFFIIFLHSF